MPPTVLVGTLSLMAAAPAPEMCPRLLAVVQTLSWSAACLPVTMSPVVKLVEENGRQFRLFYGMSSKTAMDQHAGGVANYRASEGKTVKVPYRGPILETIQDILGGVRSTCTYVGAAQLKELSKRTTFIRVQEQENPIFN